MRDPNAIDPREQTLLDEVEAMLAAEGASRQAAHSLLGLSAQLASTQPRPSADFAHRLWATLEAHRAEQPASTRLTATGHFAAFSRRQATSRPRAIQPPRVRLGRLALAVGGLASLLLLLLLTTPTARAWFTQAVERLALGQFSWVEQRASTPPPALPTSPPNQWSIETDLGVDSGPLPAGASAEIRAFSQLAEAQAAVSFHLWASSDLPTGYALREVRLPPEGVVPERAYLIFSGPARDIVLILTPVGEWPGAQPNQVTVITSLTVTNGTVELVEVNDHPAAWVDDKMLVWEADGLNFVLGSLALEQREAIRLAESLR